MNKYVAITGICTLFLSLLAYIYVRQLDTIERLSESPAQIYYLYEGTPLCNSVDTLKAHGETYIIMEEWLGIQHESGKTDTIVGHWHESTFYGDEGEVIEF